MAGNPLREPHGAKPRAARARSAGPVVVVTGVSGDLGPAVVRALWRRGARVFGVHGPSGRRALPLVKEARERGAELRLAGVDLARPGPARRRAAAIAARAVREWGVVDAFVGLAGLPARGLWRESFFASGPRHFEAIYRVDTLGQVWFVQALAPWIARRRGAIVLMSSEAALAGDELGIPFALAKGANLTLVRSLARVLAPRVRVNGVAPGPMRTSWLSELTPAERRRKRDRVLMRRFGEPEELGEAIADLALGPCRFRTGQVLVIDGGMVI
jgi:3-oxoacyl-[acyl-carrier protein] reductase